MTAIPRAGTVVTAGTPIATISDISSIKLDFTLPETFLAAIGVGQSIEAKAASYAEEIFRGQIEGIDPQIDPLTRSVAVRAVLPNEDRRLRPGMLLTVAIVTNPRVALAVPELALVAQRDQHYVFRLDAKNVANRVPVETGMRMDGMVEVVKGLNRGDRIVADGVVKVRDDAAVKPVFADDDTASGWCRREGGAAVILSDVSVKRPVFAAVISMILVLAGVVAFISLPVREYPAIEPPIVSVEVNYPGAAASVVESRITQLIEDRIAGIEGIETIRSRSRDGVSDVNIEFSATRDVDDAANDVRDRVSSALDNLPEEADPPEVRKVDADAQAIMWLNLTGEGRDPLWLADYADRILVDRFSSIDGVARIQTGGTSRPAMRIWLDRERLAAYRLTPGDIETALRAQNVELPAGRVEAQTQNLTVRVARAYRTARDFEQLVHLARRGRSPCAPRRSGACRGRARKPVQLLPVERQAGHGPWHRPSVGGQHARGRGRSPRSHRRGAQAAPRRRFARHLLRQFGVHRRRDLQRLA